MEKASTPRNRLTRSSAKQVNTPKNIDQEESVERNPAEEVKPIVRKTRRRYDSKAKVNGDSSNIENRVNNENIAEDRKGEYASETLIENSKSQTPSKTSSPNNIPSPTISRRSLRTRRSITPGPEEENCSLKKIRRSSSFGKLDLVSTPTNRRGRRAKSESKDFVFTPKPGGSLESNVIFEKIDEVIEVEKSGEDESGTQDYEDAYKNINNLGTSEFSCEDNISEQFHVDASNETESSNKTKTEIIDNVAPIKTGSEKENLTEEMFNINEQFEENKHTLDTSDVIDENKIETSTIFKGINRESSVEPCAPTKENETLGINSKINNESSESLQESDALTVENEKEENESNANKKHSESAHESSLLSLENETQLPNPTTSLEGNNSSRISSSPKEAIKSSTFKENDVIPEFSRQSEDTIWQPDVFDERINTQTCEAEKLVTVDTEETNYETSVKPNTVENITNIEIEVEEDDAEERDINEDIETSTKDPVTSYKSDGSNHEPLAKPNHEVEVKSIEIEVDEDDAEERDINKSMETSVEETITSHKNDCSNHKPYAKPNHEVKVKSIDIDVDDDDVTITSNKSHCKTQETENLTIPRIEVINSSDSEDGGIGELPKHSVMIECNDDSVFVKEKISTPAIDTDISVSFKNQFQTENISDSASEEDVQTNNDMITDNDKQKSDKAITEDSETFETFSTNKAEGSEDQSEIDEIKVNVSDRRMESPELYYMESEPDKSIGIEIENVQTMEVEDNAPDNSAFKAQNNDQDDLFQGPCPKLDEEDKYNTLEGNKNEDSPSLRIHGQEINQFGVSVDNDFKPASAEHFREESLNEENFIENYEDEEFDKSEEGSCDYKGLSDSGSSIDEKAEGSQFGESLSSELHSGSAVSEEEYATSAEDEEHDEKSGLLNEFNSSSIDLKGKVSILSKNGNEANDKNPDSPMTYDKALAIINKNRVKKIDDEEFFDMFTQELNRVSEQSGSDSDIAIVDEYIMEPEEAAKKSQPKSGNVQNPKQPPRPIGPALTNHPRQHENYSGDFSHPIHAQHATTVNQHGHPIPTQHGHPGMQRVNFTQSAMYQPIDQNMHLRGQLMFNQYAHSSSSMQDPHMYNPQHGMAHTDASFGSGMFSRPHLGSVSELPFPPANSSIKVKSLSEMNNVQSLPHQNYNNPDQDILDDRNVECRDAKDNYLNRSSTSAVHNLDTGGARPGLDNATQHEFSDKKVDESRTPILDLLGLDKKSLKLLKKALGLNSLKKELLKRDLEWQKRFLERNILKSDRRQHGRKRETRSRNIKQFKDSDSSSSKSSTERSSEESSITSSSCSKRRNCENSSESDNREVNIEDGSVFVTLKTKSKQRHRNAKELHSSYNSLLELISKAGKQKDKTKLSRKQRRSAFKRSSTKMTQKKTTMVKSQCGTFTVDPLTATSQSSDSENQSFDNQYQIKELTRIKRDLASGRNKLSNMFAQSSFKKSKKSRGNETEHSEEVKGPLKRKNSKQQMRKLPSEILETLANEDRKKRNRSEESSSDEVLPRPKKMRKRIKKLKIKSKASDQNYIPCVTGGATEFSLSRLDKDGTLTLAEKAAKFRTDQLYGAPVKRITSKELLNMKKKQNINEFVAKKRHSKK